MVTAPRTRRSRLLRAARPADSPARPDSLLAEILAGHRSGHSAPTVSTLPLMTLRTWLLVVEVFGQSVGERLLVEHRATTWDELGTYRDVAQTSGLVTEYPLDQPTGGQVHLSDAGWRVVAVLP